MDPVILIKWSASISIAAFLLCLAAAFIAAVADFIRDIWKGL